MQAYSAKLRECHCEQQGEENTNEVYQLRKVTEFTKAFNEGFPMHTRGVFLVVVNKEHCVVFDASRQPEYNPNYSVHKLYG